MPYEDDYGWQRRFIPAIKQTIAGYLITEAPAEEDQRRNTDLVVLRLDTIRVACRVRRHKHLTFYGHEFTMRAKRPSEAETELSKMLEGWGDYIFYGFANPNDSGLEAWFLGDLNVFRLWHHRKLAQLPVGKYPGKERRNKDGSSIFRVYEIGELPAKFIVARAVSPTHGESMPVVA